MDLRTILTELVTTDVEMLVEKGKVYGDSWRKRGGIGAYMMLARKWDRIEKAVEERGWDVFTAIKDVPDLIDDIIDLGNYLLLVRSEGYVPEEKDPWSEMSRRPLESTGSGNPYANVEKENLLSIGDTELLQFYGVVYQQDTTHEERSRLIDQLRYFYQCRKTGRDPDLPLSSLMASAKCVLSYRDPHAGHNKLVRFPDRVIAACDEDCGPKLYEPENR